MSKQSATRYDAEINSPGKIWLRFNIKSHCLTVTVVASQYNGRKNEFAWDKNIPFSNSDYTEVGRGYRV